MLQLEENKETGGGGGEGHTQEKLSTSSATTATECIELAHEIQTMADSAVEVLSDLLNFDKIESGTMQLELTLVQIFKLVELTAKEFVLPAVKKNINLQMRFQVKEETESQDNDVEAAATVPVGNTDGLPKSARNLRAVADVIRVTQVFRNLVSNAIKFTPEGGNILLTATWVEKTNVGSAPMKATDVGLGVGGEDIMVTKKGIMSVSVSDSGAGLDEDQVSQLFGAGVQFNANKLQEGKSVARVRMSISKQDHPFSTSTLSLLQKVVAAV